MGDRVSRRAALLGLAAVPVAGCSFEPVNFNPVTEEPTPTQSADPVRVVDQEFFLRARDGVAKNLAEGRYGSQRFSTPHLDGSLESWFVGDRLSAATAAEVGETIPLAAPEGYELVAFTMKAGEPGFVETADHAASCQLKVGSGTVIPLPGMFDSFNVSTNSYLKQWEMFVVCVAVDAPVTFQVTDEGVTISLDIRTGAPVVDDAWQATAGFRDLMDVSSDPGSGVFERAFTTLPPEGLDAQSGTLQLSFSPNTSSGLFPWTPTLGWATLGNQWLPVRMQARFAWSGDPYPRLGINIAQSFSYLDDAGAKHAAVYPTEVVTTEAIARNQVELIVFWEVSGRDASGLVSFNAVGTLEADYTNYKNMAAQFTGTPDPVEFTLGFQPRQR